MKQLPRTTSSLAGRLLVVDDDLVQRTIIGKLGARLGYDTVIASSFDVATSLLARDAFSLITLDLSLGEHDGIELLHYMADHGLHDMPVIIISGSEDRILNSTRRIAENLELTVAGCLSKPLSLDRLRQILSAPVSSHPRARTESSTSAISAEDILGGIARDEFFVEYQPKISMVSGLMVGVEALARWMSPQYGLVSPATFVPLVENYRIAGDMSEFVMTRAIRQMSGMVARIPDFCVAVNLSATQLTDLTLPEHIGSLLDQARFPASAFQVEVTETAAMDDVDRAVDIVVRLRLKGIGASLDDFGTGYSSLCALSRVPFNELKIDQSFVRGCCDDEDMAKIVKATVGLGHALNMTVVAEGIENAETLAHLRRLGCDVAQGFAIAPAMPASRLETWQPPTDGFVTPVRAAG